MSHKYDLETVQEEMEIELLEDLDIDHNGELIAAGSGTLDDRRVERMFRVHDGQLERKTIYYYEDEVLTSTDWLDERGVWLTDDGKTVITRGSPWHDNERPLDEWARRTALDLELELFEIWEDVKADNRNSDLNCRMTD